MVSGIDDRQRRATNSAPPQNARDEMPFDGNAERSAPVRLPDAPHSEPPIEARIIDEALKILGPNGQKWIQGREADQQHNHCMIGAIKLARRRLKVKGDATERLVLNVLYRDNGLGQLQFIERFNDKPGRSFNHVRETFLLAKCEALSHARRGGPPLIAEMARILWLEG
jgi:hypothetical protein